MTTIADTLKKQKKSAYTDKYKEDQPRFQDQAGKYSDKQPNDPKGKERKEFSGQKETNDVTKKNLSKRQ